MLAGLGVRNSKRSMIRKYLSVQAFWGSLWLVGFAASCSDQSGSGADAGSPDMAAVVPLPPFHLSSANPLIENSETWLDCSSREN